MLWWWNCHRVREWLSLWRSAEWAGQQQLFTVNKGYLETADFLLVMKVMSSQISKTKLLSQHFFIKILFWEHTLTTYSLCDSIFCKKGFVENSLSSAHFVISNFCMTLLWFLWFFVWSFTDINHFMTKEKIILMFYKTTTPLMLGVIGLVINPNH